jgi:predicted PurR-regulated permease PerM
MKEKINQPISISITPGSIIKILFILLLAYLLFVIRDLILVILTSVVLASAIEPFTRWFMKRKVPRPVAVITIYVILIALIAFIATAFIPPLAKDIKDVATTIPQYIQSVSEGNMDQFPGVSAILETVGASQDVGSLIERVTSLTGQATVGLFATASAIFGGLLSFILIIVLSFYLAVQEDGVGDFLRIVTPIKHEKYVIGLWKRAQRKIGLWMQGQLLLGVIVGVLTYLGLSILGVKNAFLLAILAGVFELIPIFGPILSAIPAMGIALIQDGLTLALLVAGLFAIIQQFENQLIHPLVVKKIVGIPALVAIVALIIGAQVAGFLGLIISVPIAAALMEYLSDVEKAKLEEMQRLGETK